MTPTSNGSRRRFVKGALGAAAAPAVVAGAADSAVARNASYRIAATVVRADHSRLQHGMLRIGVRLTIMSDELIAEHVVAVIDPVAFGGSTNETQQQVVAGIQRRAAQWLRQRGHEADEAGMAVQVFGLAA